MGLIVSSKQVYPSLGIAFLAFPPHCCQPWPYHFALRKLLAVFLGLTVFTFGDFYWLSWPQRLLLPSFRSPSLAAAFLGLLVAQTGFCAIGFFNFAATSLVAFSLAWFPREKVPP